MALFGKKKQPSPQMQHSGMPFEQVMGMKQQGMPNDEIAQSLQAQGYDISQVYDAISQAEMGGQAGPIPGAIPQDQFGETGMPSPPGMEPAPGYGYPGAQPAQQQSESKERIEEIAEAIIDEKWNDLLTDINKVIEWKEKTDAVIIRMQQEIKDIRASFDSLHKGILGKISEYDQNLTSVGTEIKAMERVFQKILPTFTENVNKLSRIASSKK